MYLVNNEGEKHSNTISRLTGEHDIHLLQLYAN